MNWSEVNALTQHKVLSHLKNMAESFRIQAENHHRTGLHDPRFIDEARISAAGFQSAFDRLLDLAVKEQDARQQHGPLAPELEYEGPCGTVYALRDRFKG